MTVKDGRKEKQIDAVVVGSSSSYDNSPQTGVKLALVRSFVRSLADNNPLSVDEKYCASPDVRTSYNVCVGQPADEQARTRTLLLYTANVYEYIPNNSRAVCGVFFMRNPLPSHSLSLGNITLLTLAYSLALCYARGCLSFLHTHFIRLAYDKFSDHTIRLPIH